MPPHVRLLMQGISARCLPSGVALLNFDAVTNQRASWSTFVFADGGVFELFGD
jgi:hypothetical protein